MHLDFFPQTIRSGAYFFVGPAEARLVLVAVAARQNVFQRTFGPTLCCRRLVALACLWGCAKHLHIGLSYFLT
jgi:hypothetical protein